MVRRCPIFSSRNKKRATEFVPRKLPFIQIILSRTNRSKSWEKMLKLQTNRNLCDLSLGTNTQFLTSSDLHDVVSECQESCVWIKATRQLIVLLLFLLLAFSLPMAISVVTLIPHQLDVINKNNIPTILLVTGWGFYL